ncbi:hypothetical protein IMZ48_02510 [Candidatus Bathyarchaeota archaeon]|nr:hypothetical protein [Candidatus Bathyarchaeota archaeon]
MGRNANTTQRKLPWVSTLQVSTALALANPFLWYLVDGTKPGLLLSAAVGLAGTLLLLGVSPDIMPAPSLPSPLGTWAGNNSSDAQGPGAGWGGESGGPSTVETGIWMVSVLFCSCVCFGNVGRRLALSRDAARTGA